jgi:hypothetical protein
MLRYELDSQHLMKYKIKLNAVSLFVVIILLLLKNKSCGLNDNINVLDNGFWQKIIQAIINSLDFLIKVMYLVNHGEPCHK